MTIRLTSPLPQVHNGQLEPTRKFWLPEVPVFDAMTQGQTRKEALEMIGDWFASLVTRKGFSVEVHPRGRGEFQVSSADARTMVEPLAATAAPPKRSVAGRSGSAAGREIT